MTRVAAITAAHREYLRTLKAEFDTAFALIQDITDRQSPEFSTAEVLYKRWIKAIDSNAVALLDDLDAFDIGGGGPTRPPVATERRVPPSTLGADDVDHVFADMADLLYARALVETDDDLLDSEAPE